MKIFHIRIIALLLLSAVSIQLFGQITKPGIPLYNPQIDTLLVPAIKLDAEQRTTELKKSESEGIRFKKDEFAIPVEVVISPDNSGIWYNFPESNKKVWLLAITAEKAKSMYFIFGKYRLDPGTKVFLYDKEQHHILGALTNHNNKEWESLATTLIKSDTIYIELQVPLYKSDYGLLELSEVGVEIYSDTKLKSTNDRFYNTSAACHENANCFSDFYADLQKRSVCRIIYRGGDRCTGTLINNLTDDQTPYVLTAAHCFTTDFIANNAVFDFNYESPGCENTDVPFQSISGASIVSYSPNLDFLLVKLSENIPEDYNPYFSGWDARGIAPESSYTFHHPQGDIRKVSVDDDRAITGNFTGFDENTHWYIEDYEMGSTEDGSSGCGLISEENYLIGTLTGGGATCSPLIKDFYQKFSHAYSDYTDSLNQLKYWLDPLSYNVLTCNGLDVLNSFRNTAEIITNVKLSDQEVLLKQNEGWGYLSGHNYQENSLFAEKYTVNGSKYLYGANINLGRIYSNTTDQHIILSLWSGNQTPEELIYQQQVALVDMEGMQTYEVDFDSNIFVHKQFFFGYKINYQEDTFAVRTINTIEEENTAFTYLNNKWQPLQIDGANRPSKLSVELLAFDFQPEQGVQPDTADRSNVFIYPNPSSTFFNVYFRNGIEGKIGFEIFDLSGRPVYNEIIENIENNYPVEHNLPMGVYILRILQNGAKVKTFKLLIL